MNKQSKFTESRLKLGQPYGSKICPPILDVRHVGVHQSAAVPGFEESCIKRTPRV